MDDGEGIVRAVCLRLGIATGDKPRLGVRWRPRDPVEVALRLRREGDLVIVTGDMGEGRTSLPVAEAAAMGRRLAPGRTPTPGMARAACEEGFEKIAGWFEHIAKPPRTIWYRAAVGGTGPHVLYSNDLAESVGAGPTERP